MEIDLSRLPEVINDNFYPMLFDETPLEVFMGGANSGKSYFAAQKIMFKLLQPEHRRVLMCRKVKKDVRHSCYDLLKYTISNLGFGELFKFNDTETIVTCKLNGNDAIGVGLDDVEKLKSIFDPTDFWGEEADQMTYNDIDQLMLRLRGSDNSVKQGMLTFNPVWVGHWLKKEYFDKKVPGVITHRSNYKTNKFLDAKTRAIMESITDPYRKMVYVDGEWGVYGNRVFSDFVIEDFKYTEDDLENVFTGMDFGFAHASVIERGGFRDGELYIFDELYGKGWENSTFIRAAQEYFGDALYTFNITADSAEPDRIAEWKSAGYHVEAAVKGPGSYAYGIDFLKSFTIHIHEKNCPNLQREIQTFERRSNKLGEITEEFIQENDDCIAACLSGDTIVNTKDGDFKIKDLVGKEGEVYSFNGKEPTLERFNSVALTRHSKIVYTIELEDGGIIEATEDHPILTSRGWVEVKDLKEDDEVVQIGTN